MRLLRILPVFVLVGALLAASAMTVTATGGRPHTTTMSGAEEAPGPGDPDGTGWAGITVNVGLGRVCWWLEVSGIEPATAAHIHIGPPGSPGPVVVPLSAPTDGRSSGCADVERDLAKAILKDPSAYYVNVHNAAYPGGAVRGQLGD
ncbi:MAG: CHRD domain-containing protein [Candidatus Limnocylindria bacterium]